MANETSKANTHWPSACAKRASILKACFKVDREGWERMVGMLVGSGVIKRSPVGWPGGGAEAGAVQGSGGRDMKRLPVKTVDGQPVKGWSFGTFRNVWNVGNGRPRKISGWTLRDPDGYERNCEGNWQQFVPFVRQVVENYGFKTNIS